MSRKKAERTKAPLLYVDYLRTSNVFNGVLSLLNALIHVSFAICVGVFLEGILKGENESVTSFIRIVFFLGVLKFLSTYLLDILNVRAYTKLHSRLTKEIIFYTTTISW